MPPPQGIRYVAQSLELGQFLQISCAHAAALVFVLFFPVSDAMVSTLAALNVYALAYVIALQLNSSRGNEMTTQSSHASPILVTGAAGAVGSIGRNVTEMLLAKGHKVRALVRREDERAAALRQLGAEVMQGDLTDLIAMHRAIEGCARVYFGMSVSADYLTATVNTAAVARHHGVEAFVNMSQMTVTQMNITESTESPHTNCTGWRNRLCPGRASRSSPCGPRCSSTGSSGFSLPGRARRRRTGAANGRRQNLSDLGCGLGARRIGRPRGSHAAHRPDYNLTGFELADLEHYARVFSEALGRTIRYRDVPLPGWSEKLLQVGVPAHTVKHLSVMTELNKQGRYDRMTDDLFNLTGQKPISMYDFVKLHAAEFTRAWNRGLSVSSNRNGRFVLSQRQHFHTAGGSFASTSRRDFNCSAVANFGVPALPRCSTTIQEDSCWPATNCAVI